MVVAERESGLGFLLLGPEISTSGSQSQEEEDKPCVGPSERGWDCLRTGHGQGWWSVCAWEEYISYADWGGRGRGREQERESERGPFMERQWRRSPRDGLTRYIRSAFKYMNLWQAVC